VTAERRSPSISRSAAWWLVGLAVLAIIAIPAFAYKASTRMPDFEVYWRAASRAMAGESLYRAEDGHWLFKYLPAFAVVAMPIALLPVQVAKAIWFMATVVTLVLLLRASPRLLSEVRKPQWVLVLATFLVLGKFYVHEMVLGQTNLMFVAVITAALLCMKRQQEAAAGVLIVVAIVLKPYAVILLPWLLVRRQSGSIIAAAIGMTGVLVLPIVRYGFARTVQLHFDWWQTVLTSTEPNLSNPDNVSWLSMYSKWFHIGGVAETLALATAVIAFAVVVHVYRLRRGLAFPELLEGALLLVLMPLLSPQGWDYVLLVATPAILCLVNYDDRLAPVMRALTIGAMIVIGFSIYDLIGRTAYRVFMRVSGITLCFFVVIAALAALRRGRVA
jgi:alpha-1,2-mannosyltransferase